MAGPQTIGPPKVPRPDSAGRRVQRYWERLTEGANLDQLWKQFSADARQSYALYSREVDWESIQAKSRWKRALHASGAVFQSMLMKLSPARRVLLLVSLVLLIYPLPAMLLTDHWLAETAVAKLFVLGASLLFVLLALELADRVTMKRDLEIAREIQHWLLPEQPPTVPGAQIAFASRPANTVAGDYYDVLPRAARDGKERWLIVVADVAGKSIPAALLMATFQASLHTLVGASDSLLDLVIGLNGYACAHSQGGRRFTTAFFAEYEPQTRSLTYINAGHNAPVLKRKSGQFEYLKATGLPLGIAMEASGPSSYAAQICQLDSGDTLVIFTDGLVEAVNAQGTEYGDDRLLAALQFPIRETAALMLERLFAEVNRFVGETHQQDDITCVVFQSV
ncbi:MAG TPA: PP2C family protein-serine/threonine phosphatase [Candidatus Angelobacter sp.]|jgi:phosphoserine phosphatase RsbU/P|nr:PP2C family protein-serine/threonine phosphatase [Candidatus Angelobacter sp.]